MEIKLDSYIKTIADFPKKGILFRDITPILADANAFRYACKLMLEKIKIEEVDFFIGIESRGFIFASYIACLANKGLIMLRKKNKLPPPTITHHYQLEYGKDTFEIKPFDNLISSMNNKVAVVDDVLATGGTLNAAKDICYQAGYNVTSFVVLIDLLALHSKEFQINNIKVEKIIEY